MFYWNFKLFYNISPSSRRKNKITVIQSGRLLKNRTQKTRQKAVKACFDTVLCKIKFDMQNSYSLYSPNTFKDLKTVAKSKNH